MDIPGFIRPCSFTGDSLCPDFPLVTRDKCLYILELTVSFESNLRTNSHRKQLKYKTLIREHQKNFNDVIFVNLSMSALGLFDHLTKSFLEMLQDLKFDVTSRNFISRRTMTSAIRTTYYIAVEIKIGTLQNFLYFKADC